MDDDLDDQSREALVAEVKRLRAGIRAHRDSSGHDLCWHHPQLWSLLPERVPARIAVPAWPQFMRGCIRYRQSLDVQNPEAPRTAQEFAASKGSLWHANGAARERLRADLAPSSEHAHARDIDYQIEADFSGLVSPGLPARVVELGDFFGGLLCNDECVHGGQFMGCLYAEAFFTKDPQTLIERALDCIPAEGEYARTIREVLTWYRQYPRWQDTWQALEATYNNEERARCQGEGTGKEGERFNISASFNGAYVVMGLLYGEEDPTKTLRLTTGFGQDSDCNPSSALGVLFTTIGAAKLPREYRERPPAALTFSGTAYNFARVVEVTEEVARHNVLSGGGQIVRAPNGAEVFLLPITPLPKK